ncbi:MAG: Nramp family divalent metal transporter [Actinomycetes bacterium]
MILVALGVGLGETYMWPRLVVLFGPDIRWLFLVGVSLQAVVMMEMARYALATGESIFFGAARVFKPLMWLFFVTALLTYIWPGHIAGGALALGQIIDVNYVVLGIVGLLTIGLVFSFATVIYNLLENVLSVLIGVLVLGSAIVASIVGSMEHVSSTLTGMFAFGYFPSEAHTALWFPVIVGSIAFAGPSGMQQMWYTLYLRDKGAGMGAYLPKIRGLTHSGEEETMPDRGYMFDTDNPAEVEKWKGWRRWVNYDAIVLFWGITMLVTIVFTVLAQAASARNPNVADLLRADEQDAALQAMADAFSAAGGPALGTFFFGFIALVAWKSSLGLFDAFSRGQADITYYFIPGMKRFKMSHIYFGFLWGVILFGCVTLVTMGDSDGPGAILDLLAFLSAFSMGAYCIVLLLVNNTLLPKKIRPNILTNAIIAFGAVFYLGAQFYSLFKFGAPLD